MGSVMFLLVPVAAGFAISMVTTPVESMMASAALSLLVALGILIASKAEGVLCLVLAFPLLILRVCSGLRFGYLFRKHSGDFAGGAKTLGSVVLLRMPVVIYGGRRREVVRVAQTRQEAVTSRIHLPAEPEQICANIHSLDNVTGRKPLLMYMGLPIPRRCARRGSGAGAKRTCYFNQGYIEETVLEWSPPIRLRLTIDRTNMPGRHWLEFEGAEYELHPEGGRTALARTTTIVSNLYPEWYWRRFERWGVESEHEYLFSDLAPRFSSRCSPWH
jgi:hypothetical protein